MIIRALASRWFFFAICGFFALQALWIALSANYPMAFDEDFHLGLIRLYAEHPSPFWSAHPEGGNAFGALTRDPSYLFHWLMSFPYRFIVAVTDSLMAQVVFLRVLNIAMFAASLPLFYKLLRKVGASPALTNTSLAILVLIPITPFLAGQINYDNLLMPVVAAMLLITIRIADHLRAQRVDSVGLVALLVLGLFACLIKYAALPLFVAAFGYVVFIAIRSLRPRALMQDFGTSVRRNYRRPVMIGLVLVLGVLSLLSFERYGINVIQYGGPVADCGQVLTYNECKSYGPWIRDYNLALNNTNTPHPPKFVWEWLYGMWHRCFFAVDGSLNSFRTRGPLLVPAVLTIVLAVASLVALAWRARRVWARNNSAALWLSATVIVVYIGILFAQQYGMYVEVGKAVAINGRYLMPIFPLLFVIAGLALREVFRTTRLKSVLASITILGFLWGGGAATYILRSDSSWYWPNSPLTGVNELYRDVKGPLTPGYNKSNLFLR